MTVFIECSCLVVVHDVPAEVVAEGLGDGGGAVRAGHGGVVLKTVAADVAHEGGQAGHAHDGLGAEGVEGGVGEGGVADVGADAAGEIVGGDAAEGDGAGGG